MSQNVWYKTTFTFYEWISLRTPLSVGNQKNESCHTSEWVMAHIQRRVVLVEIKEWAMSHKWMSHVTHTMARGSCGDCRVMSPIPLMIESCRTKEWAMSRKWMSHVTRTMARGSGGDCRVIVLLTLMSESCHTYEWVVSRTQWRVVRDNTLQHTTTHYNTLQHTATHCNTL